MYHTLNTHILFQGLRVLKLTDINQYFISICKYKEVHHYNTRFAHHFRSIKHHYHILKHSYSVTGPKIWNDIPVTIQQSISIFRLKKSMKSLLRYIFICVIL